MPPARRGTLGFPPSLYFPPSPVGTMGCSPSDGPAQRERRLCGIAAGAALLASGAVPGTVSRARHGGACGGHRTDEVDIQPARWAVVLWTEPGPPPPIAGLWTPIGVSAGVSNPRPRAVAGRAPLTGLVTEERRETGVLITSHLSPPPRSRSGAGAPHFRSARRAELWARDAQEGRYAGRAESSTAGFWES